MNKLTRNLRYDWPLHLVYLLTNWLPDNVKVLQWRGAWMRPFLGSCGKGLEVGRNVNFYNPTNIHIGKNVYIAFGCVLLGIGDITIDDEVMLSPYVVLSAGNHLRLDDSYRYGDVEVIPIHIGKGTWIGTHSTILGGADIGSGCIIASNSAVTRGYIPGKTLYGGVPAKLIKEL